VQIVRQLQRLLLKNNDQGTANVALPNGFNPQGWEVIGFIQNKSNGEIIGASKGAFPAGQP
jgi:hypothetical protein